MLIQSLLLDFLEEKERKILLIELKCYAGTSVRGIRASYTVGEVCRRLQAMQAITW